MMNQSSLRTLLAATLVAAAGAFTSPQLHAVNFHQQTSLFAVIRGDEINNAVSEGAGGVHLARDSAIKITGEVKHKPGSANPKPAELLRYTQFQQVSDDLASSVKIVCTGRGTEVYRDPGDSTVKDVAYAPHDAVRDALNAAGSTQDADRLVINFLGGDDLQVMEVLEAVEQLVLNLDVKTKTKITFNSLCHGAFPMEQAALTVVKVEDDSDSEGAEQLKGVEKALADGEVYFQDGKYFTVVKEDITDAVE
ncbi:expressed unknown protein [Seminavis robusta]|uniref:Uncharacterized protein n=1 Tax=Seminavis robusta TaxID=568900 RepID=A0A9N8ELS1_9STRA|nr:expressed unknown protein [Seminavis robusta]|eukprot:Sro1328_g263150.1 n/a (251) ;mRNA; r:3107-3859